jgi:hypothetical protein
MSYLLHTWHLPHRSCHWSDSPNNRNVWRSTQIMKFQIMQFLHLPVPSSPSHAQTLPRHPIPQHPNCCYFLGVRRSYTLIQNKKCTYSFVYTKENQVGLFSLRSVSIHCKPYFIWTQNQTSWVLFLKRLILYTAGTWHKIRTLLTWTKFYFKLRCGVD